MIAVPQDDVPSPQLEGSGTWFLWVVVDGSLPSTRGTAQDHPISLLNTPLGHSLGNSTDCSSLDSSSFRFLDDATCS